jgi:hypothetical protein
MLFRAWEKMHQRLISSFAGSHSKGAQARTCGVGGAGKIAVEALLSIRATQYAREVL